MPSLEQTVTFNVTPEDVADLFLAMDSRCQARCLGRIANRAVEEWGAFKADQQWCEVGLAISEQPQDRLAGEFVEAVSAHYKHWLVNPRPQVVWHCSLDERTAPKKDVRRPAPPGCTQACVFPGKCTTPCPGACPEWKAKQ